MRLFPGNPEAAEVFRENLLKISFKAKLLCKALPFLMLWDLAVTGYQLKVSFVRLILQDFALQQGIVPLYGLNRMVIMYSFRLPLTSVPTSVSRLLSFKWKPLAHSTCTHACLKVVSWLFYGCTQVQSISKLTTYNIIYTFVYNSLSFLVLFWCLSGKNGLFFYFIIERRLLTSRCNG